MCLIFDLYIRRLGAHDIYKSRQLLREEVAGVAQDSGNKDSGNKDSGNKDLPEAGTGSGFVLAVSGAAPFVRGESKIWRLISGLMQVHCRAKRIGAMTVRRVDNSCPPDHGE